MKVKDIPVLRQKVLNMLPVLQSEVWKKLDLSSREGSELIEIMLSDKLIKRKARGKTFLIVVSSGGSNGDTSEEAIDIKEKPSELQKKVLGMLPITQSDLWKKLNIDSSSCSELIRKMADKKLIKRTKQKSTYWLEKIENVQEEVKPEKESEPTEKEEVKPSEVVTEKKVKPSEEIASEKEEVKPSEEIVTGKTEKKEVSEEVSEVVKPSEEVVTEKEEFKPSEEVSEVVKPSEEVVTEKEEFKPSEPSEEVVTEKEEEVVTEKEEVKPSEEAEVVTEKTEKEEVCEEVSEEIQEETKPERESAPDEVSVPEAVHEETKPEKIEEEIPEKLIEVESEKEEVPEKIPEKIVKEVKEEIEVSEEVPEGVIPEEIEVSEEEDEYIENEEDVEKGVDDMPAKKLRDIPALRKQVLEMLPIMQSEIWKKLDIDRRGCSRLINDMIEQNLIKKTKIGGTYLIEGLNGDKAPKKDFSALLSKDGKFSPCCGCEKECEPIKCSSLIEWTLC